MNLFRSAQLTYALLLPWFIFPITSAIADNSLPSTVQVIPITDLAKLQAIRAEFQYEWGHIGYVTDCHHAVDYVEQMASGHDYSYGAICSVASHGEKKEWMMCNDWMIGRFTRTDKFKTSVHTVAKFVHDHCPPGG